MTFFTFPKTLFHWLILFTRPMTLGVRILVENEQKQILLVRHTYVPGWYFPGGGVETRESQYEAAEKELWEETGIRAVGDMELISVHKNSAATPRDHVTFFRCANWEVGRAFKANREIAEIGFFDLDGLPDDITPGTKRRIDEVYGNTKVNGYW